MVIFVKTVNRNVYIFNILQLANCISGLDDKVKDLQQMLMSGDGEEGRSNDILYSINEEGQLQKVFCFAIT